MVPSGVGESAPGPGVSWGGNSGCHLAQPHICGHATIPCPTIYVDTQPPPSPPPYYPFNARHTVLLPSPCALVAKGLNCLRLVIKMIVAVVMMMAMITIMMTIIITLVGSQWLWSSRSSCEPCLPEGGERLEGCLHMENQPQGNSSTLCPTIFSFCLPFIDCLMGFKEKTTLYHFLFF